MQLQNCYDLAFPTGRDSATFRDKGTTGQAQNLAKGLDGPGQPVKTGDGTRDRMVPDFDSFSAIR